VWVLGFVSLLMDLSSEMVHSLLPMFLVGTLGVSVLAVGVIEGIAEATALIGKVFTGALSDGLGRRKGLAVLGSAWTKKLGETGAAFALLTLAALGWSRWRSGRGGGGQSGNAAGKGCGLVGR